MRDPWHQAITNLEDRKERPVPPAWPDERCRRHLLSDVQRFSPAASLRVIATDEEILCAIYKMGQVTSFQLGQSLGISLQALKARLEVLRKQGHLQLSHGWWRFAGLAR